MAQAVRRRKGISLWKDGSLPFEPVSKLGGRHVDVPQNLAERARLEWAVAVNGHDRIRVTAIEKVMAAANAEHRESLALQETQHFLAAGARELSHESVQPGQGQVGAQRRAAARAIGPDRCRGLRCRGGAPL